MVEFSRRVNLQGPIFRSGTAKQALKRAKQAAMEFGVGEIGTWTPVKTGRLKAGWRHDDRSKIYNEVPYTKYVEEGTYKMEGYFMVRDTLPRIEDYFGDMVQRFLQSEGLID
jgi:hypothetical protein